jgi:glycosyltransferase involved in cell wall biosynthesis
MPPAEFAVILPVYNEAETLSEVLGRVLEYCGARLVVVDDGSTDRTAEILDKYSLEAVLKHPRNLGYGRALIDGFRYVVEKGFETCITMDADAQHEPGFIPCFLEKIKQFDVVSGSRYLNPILSQGTPPPERLEINRLITDRLRTLTGYPLTDSFCGFKAYRTEGLRRMKLTEENYGFPLQVWMQAARAGLTVTECAIPLVYRDHSRNFNNRFATREERLAHYLEVLEREQALGPNRPRG